MIVNADGGSDRLPNQRASMALAPLSTNLQDLKDEEIYSLRLGYINSI